MKVFVSLICLLLVVFIAIFEFEDTSPSGEEGSYSLFDLIDRRFLVTVNLEANGRKTSFSRILTCRVDLGLRALDGWYRSMSWGMSSFGKQLTNGSEIVVSLPYPARYCDLTGYRELRWGSPLLPRLGWVGERQGHPVIEDYRVFPFQQEVPAVTGGHIDVSTIRISVEKISYFRVPSDSSGRRAYSWFGIINPELQKECGHGLYRDHLYEGYSVWELPEKEWRKLPDLSDRVGIKKTTLLNVSEKVSADYGSPQGLFRNIGRSQLQWERYFPLLKNDNSAEWHVDASVKGFDIYWRTDLKTIPVDSKLTNVIKYCTGVSDDAFGEAGAKRIFHVQLEDFDLPWDVDSATYPLWIHFPKRQVVKVISKLGHLRR